MQEYALDHVRDGLTTLDEVEHVVPFQTVESDRCGACRREVSADFSFCPCCGEKRIAGAGAISFGSPVTEQGVVAE